MKKLKTNLIITSILFLCFIVFTLFVSLVGVEKVGPLGSEIGFASLNVAVFNKIGVNQFFYSASEGLGVITFIVIACFLALGIYQLIKGKSLKKVDVKLYALACFYVLTFLFYILFEVITINYRPVIIDGELEASYPSSHTILSLCVISSAIIILNDILKDNKALKITAVIVGVVIMTATVILRFLSGVHWFTDIVGGIFLSSALVSLFYTAISYLKEKHSN